MSDQQYISIAEASRQLGFKTADTIRQAIAKGELRAYQFSSGRRGTIHLYLPDWEAWKAGKEIIPPTDQPKPKRRTRRSLVERLEW